jgi:hypothetical protein
MEKEVRYNHHYFERRNVKFVRQCKYCNIILDDDETFWSYGQIEESLPSCLSDEEKIIKDIVE